MRPLEYKHRDKMAYLIMVIYLVIGALVKKFLR